MDPRVKIFFEERAADMTSMANDPVMREISLKWMERAEKYKYSYNFTWMGVPIIKYPNDIVVQQELVNAVRPDLIIETGIAHGGSLVLSASLQQMMGIDGHVIGVDIDIRQHNREVIESHPMSKFISMFEGNSFDPSLVKEITKISENYDTVMVILDSNHTEEHVYQELVAYAPLVSKGSYIVLPDTFIEFMPKGYFDRPWDVGNNPYTALHRFLSENSDFVIDYEISSKAVISESFDGYLKRIS